MRLKHVPGAQEAIEKSSYVFIDPKEEKGKWKEIFANAHPIYIEGGMGKGQFITTLARMNPQINYIGIEKYSSVLVRAVEKVQDEEIPNLKFICMDATEIEDVFVPDEVDRIYLNFSDPWPKDRHAKRRLTSERFLKRYEHILKKEGLLEFKTDNEGLFTFSLEEIPAAGWTILQYTNDLHHDEQMNAGNVMTEYEQKFSEKGNPIYKCIAKQGSAPLTNNEDK